MTNKLCLGRTKFGIGTNKGLGLEPPPWQGLFAGNGGIGRKLLLGNFGGGERGAANFGTFILSTVIGSHF